MLKLVAAAALAASTFAVLPTATSYAAPTSDPARVLIVGDSVTQGYRGDHTWRYFAWKALGQAGTSVDFVGPRTSTFDIAQGGNTVNWHYNGPDAYADPNFDQDHASYWGQRLGPSWMQEPITGLLQSYPADVVVSNLGINDLSDGTAQQLADRYETWVTDARAVDPGVDLVVVKVPQTWKYDSRPEQFNGLLEDLADELSTATSRVVVAEAVGFVQADTWDGVHVTESGERKIAGAVGAALTSLGLPAAQVPVSEVPAEQPPVTPSPVEPSPVAPVPAEPSAPVLQPALVAVQAPGAPQRVRAVRTGRKVAVSWRGVAGAERYDVACGRTVTTVSRLGVRMKSSARSCRVRAVNAGGSSSWVKAPVRTARRG